MPSSPLRLPLGTCLSKSSCLNGSLTSDAKTSPGLRCQEAVAVFQSLEESNDSLIPARLPIMIALILKRQNAPQVLAVRLLPLIYYRRPSCRPWCLPKYLWVRRASANHSQRLVWRRHEAVDVFARCRTPWKRVPWSCAADAASRALCRGARRGLPRPLPVCFVSRDQRRTRRRCLGYGLPSLKDRPRLLRRLALKSWICACSRC